MRKIKAWLKAHTSYGWADDVPPPASSGHDDDDSDDGNVAAWMSGLGL